ncbi:MAG TPA: hypothetical protein VFZ56_03625 [Gemmatimonadaceae bacterium]
MSRTVRHFALACLVCTLAPGVAAGQGNLGTQGFGYPPGQLSARGLATGGAVGEIDPQSAINPATPMLWGATVLFGQYDPEFRRVDVPGTGSARTMIARFPGAGVSFLFGSRVAAGLNVSTWLDRTWSTQFDYEQVIGTDTVTGTNVITSEGSISDLRVALAYAITPRISFGLGGHFFTGENRFIHQQTFPDTVRFSGMLETSNVTYGGIGISAGFEARIRRIWQIAASARTGGDITSQSGDTTLTTARVPLRYGAGVTYFGLQGAQLSARAAFEEWSSLQPLGSDDVTAFDSWDFGIGADVTGPRIGRRLIMVRLGARHRTLPFGARGQKVEETSFSGGLGIPISVDRAMLDFGIARATRDAGSVTAPGFPGGVDVGESAYILSFGIRVRP